MNIMLNYTLSQEDWDDALGKNPVWVAHNWAARILLIIVVVLGVGLIVFRQGHEGSISSAFFSIALALLVAAKWDDGISMRTKAIHRVR